MSGLIIKRQLVYASQLVLLRLVNCEFSFSRADFYQRSSHLRLIAPSRASSRFHRNFVARATLLLSRCEIVDADRDARVGDCLRREEKS